VRHQSALSLLLIDVDSFKAFNDDFGHQAGDAALQSVAQALRCGRPSDFLARYGGEEFAVILPATTSEGACIVAERMRMAVATAAWPHRPITVSIGAASLGPGGTTSAKLVAAADQALYAAKANGRNRVARSAAMTAA